MIVDVGSVVIYSDDHPDVAFVYENCQTDLYLERSGFRTTHFLNSRANFNYMVNFLIKRKNYLFLNTDLKNLIKML